MFLKVFFFFFPRDEGKCLSSACLKNLYPANVKFNNLTQGNYSNSNNTCKYSKD